jgi:hypothetical protein
MVGMKLSSARNRGCVDVAQIHGYLPAEVVALVMAARKVHVAVDADGGVKALGRVLENYIVKRLGQKWQYCLQERHGHSAIAVHYLPK